MIGAVCGDILGSTYEFGNLDKEIYLMHGEDHFTDDSVLTFAVAQWALEYENTPLGDGEHKYLLAQKFYDFTVMYPDRAYGRMYINWIWEYKLKGKIPLPNNSYGNGAAMRVSPVAYAFEDIDKVEIKIEGSKNTDLCELFICHILAKLCIHVSNALGIPGCKTCKEDNTNNGNKEIKSA